MKPTSHAAQCRTHCLRLRFSPGILEAGPYRPFLLRNLFSHRLLTSLDAWRVNTLLIQRNPTHPPSSSWPTSKSPTGSSRRSAGGGTKYWVLRPSPSLLFLFWSACRSKIPQLSWASAHIARIPLHWYPQPLLPIIHLVLPVFLISRLPKAIPLPCPWRLHLWLLPTCNMGLNFPHYQCKHRLPHIFLQNTSQSRSQMRYLSHHWPTPDHKKLFDRSIPPRKLRNLPHRSQWRQSFRK